MNKLNKLLALIVAAACTICLALPAFADLIIDPHGDSFYKKHMRECEVGDFRSYVSLESGIQVYDEPDGKLIATLPAGEKVGTNCIYSPENGDKWGYRYSYNDPSKEGWFKLADTLRLYDGTDFENEHFSEMRNYNGEPVEFDSAVLYEYPGGPVNFTDWSTGDEGDAIGFAKVYTDENGKQWGFIGYHYGHVDSWVCIDDPANDKLSAAELPLIDPVTGEKVKTMPITAAAAATENTDDPAAGETERPGAVRQTFDPNTNPDTKLEDKRGGGKSPWLIAGIVAAAAAACAAVLGVCFKKKKQN